MRNTLSIVVSAYNEEGNVAELHRQIKAAVAGLGLKSVEIIFVDDGSRDGTDLRVLELQKKDKAVKLVRLSRNMGHEVAMVAGMNHASGDAVLFMDADLQHPPALVPEMVRLWRGGKDIVLTRRTDNAGTGALYKMCSGAFYSILNFFSDVEIPKNTPDFRLIDRKYADYFKTFDERDFMFRGILSMITSLDAGDVATVEFAAPKRLSGESKYGFLKSLRLALNRIMQFSTRPLYLSLWLAIVFGIMAAGLGVYVIIEKYMRANPTPGYATIVAAVVFMGATNLFVLAIIGAYIGKIHIETKKRPLYLAEFIEAGSGAKRGTGRAEKNNKRR
jgi:dolichol-phosphate mannosyltransferase